MKDLPEFASRPYKQVHGYIARVLTNERAAQVSSLERLIVHDDGHFRAVFRPDYFTLVEGATAPTSSQWNTLKKRMKRIDRSVFIFKEHGDLPCESVPETCYYVDFGFLRSDGRAG